MTLIFVFFALAVIAAFVVVYLISHPKETSSEARNIMEFPEQERRKRA